MQAIVMVAIALLLGAALKAVRDYRKRVTLKKAKERRTETIKKLSKLDWPNAKQALEMLKAVHPYPSYEVEPIAYHYLMEVRHNLEKDSLTFKAAMKAREKFKEEWKQVEDYCRVFGLDSKFRTDFGREGKQHTERLFMAQQVLVLEATLTHYPESGFLNGDDQEYTAGAVFSRMLDLSGSIGQRPDMEKWKELVKAANLRQAEYNLRLLRERRRVRYPSDFMKRTDLLRNFLAHAKEGPEAIGSSHQELEAFHQLGQEA